MHKTKAIYQGRTGLARDLAKKKQNKKQNKNTKNTQNGKHSNRNERQ